jgi:hypothetical protein
MNRDMEAIRNIVIAIKNATSTVDTVEGVKDDVFKFNAMLLIEAGLAKGTSKQNSRTSTAIPDVVIIHRLTWEGFDFADAIKDDTIWEKAKEIILKPTCSWTFGILLEYLKQEIKTKLGMNSIP